MSVTVAILSSLLLFITKVEAADYSQLDQLTQSEQVIIVRTDRLKNQKATLQTYEKQNGHWAIAHPPIQAVLGYNGMDLKTKEGDGKTPIGVYDIGTGFGTAPKPTGVTIPYRRAGDHDYWIDDPTSPDYNKWVHYTGDPTSRWKSFERMKIDSYKYGAVINYNTDPIVAGKGSAIFLHVWRNSSSPTAGCVAVSEQNMVRLLQWLDPAKKPLIVHGLNNQVNDLLQSHIEEEAFEDVSTSQFKANQLKDYYQLTEPQDAVATPAFEAAYNETKKAISAAQHSVNAVTNPSQKSWLQEQLRYADELRVRAARIIDSTNTSKSLKLAQVSLKEHVDRGVLSEQAVAAYHHLSSEIRKSERSVSRIYGQMNRELAGKQFILPAKIERETVIWEVTIYELLSQIEGNLAVGNTETTAADFALIDRLKVRSIDIKQAGNELHPGMYPSLPSINTSLLEWETRLRESYQ